ncbi:SDR family NAD(P)-dependent oxidoreductase [Devosia rhizoryzae]|uniref:SDR family oxidoreductase n=1 Tax=Devosia rhizoryzae TaxID=2774137 RepID=A0ABX7C2W6_9HYPH|nr:SDR family oxidoreductase [Devosia rhizoryzae]QQR38421.1 SDR family oxidoreductase [Devosia rhizoryzae]
MGGFTLDLPRSVLVSGAAGGIGGALVDKLVASGSEVIGTDRHPAPPHWRGQHWLTADIGSKSGRDAIVARLNHPIGGLVFAAGILDTADWQTIDEDAAAELLAVNLTAPLFLTRALLPLLAGASIVIVGSIAGLRGSPATPLYAASKAGLRNLAASMALLLQPNDIRVNVVAPGLIDTPLTAGLNAELAQRRNISIAAIEAERAAPIPLGRAGTSQEVADACLYLLSRQSGYVTGSTLFATGGVLAGIT